MVLQNSGTIKISEIQSEFGDSSPVSLSEHYRNSGLVPDITLNLGIPTSGTISLSDFYESSVSTFSISSDKTTVTESETITFTVTTSNYSGTLYWSLSTSSITDSDFSSPVNSESSGGTLEVSGNTGSITFTLNADSLTEGAEYFRLVLKANSQFGTEVARSALITVSDTSLSPSYSLSAPASVNEGTTLVITLNTQNVSDGTSIPYTITGISSSDLTSGSLTGSFTINSNTGSISLGLAQESGGSGISKFYIGGSTNRIRQYNLGSPISSSTAISDYNFGVNAKFIHFNDDGTKVFYSDEDKVITEASLSVPYDITSLSSAPVSKTLNETGDLGGGFFNPTGTRFFWSDRSGRKIFQHGMWDPWNITSLNSNAAYEWSINLPLPGRYSGLAIGNNGQYIYLASLQYGKVYMYEMANSYSIGPTNPSIIAPGAIDLNSPIPRDLCFNGDGSKMFVSYDTFVDQYDLTTPWDIFTSSYTSTFDVSSVETGADGLFVISTPTEGNEILTLSLDNGSDSINVEIVDVV